MSAQRTFLFLIGVAARAAMPVPPHQHDPWTPPPGLDLPDSVVKASALLFEAGVADPRGGDYREIEIAAYGASVKTHGWVFEGTYAVCWNGLIYRVRSLG